MPSDKQRLVCDHCGTKELFYRSRVNHPLHIALSILTGGLWLISYIALMVGQPFQPWICSACDHRQQAPGRPPAKVPPDKVNFFQKVSQRAFMLFQHVLVD